jgi:hypothetical protein
VAWPEVAYLRVVGLLPTQWTGLSTEPVCVGSRLHKPTVCTRLGGHRRQMEAQSHVPCLMELAYSHPIPMGWGSAMG